MIQPASKGLCGAALIVTVLAGLPATAAAQSEGRFAVGVQVTPHFFVNDELANGVGIGVAYRLTRASTHDGWGPDVGFGWFSTDLESALDGRITVRPLMGGISYRIVRGKIRTHFGLIGGPAFSKVEVNDDERAAYTALVGMPVNGVDVERVTWAVKPGVKVTYDLKPRLGIFTGLDYEIVRPQLLLRTSAGTIERKLKADTVRYRVGFMVGIF